MKIALSSSNINGTMGASVWKRQIWLKYTSNKRKEMQLRRNQRIRVAFNKPLVGLNLRASGPASALPVYNTLNNRRPNLNSTISHRPVIHPTSFTESKGTKTQKCLKLTYTKNYLEALVLTAVYLKAIPTYFLYKGIMTSTRKLISTEVYSTVLFLYLSLVQDGSISTIYNL